MESQGEVIISEMISQGVDYLESNDLDKAKKKFEEILELDPVNGLSFSNLGKIAMKESKFNEAIDYFEQSLKYTPESVNSIVHLGFSLKAIGKIKEVPIKISNALELQGDNRKIFEKAYAQMNKRKIQQAYKQFEKILTKDPQNIKLLRYVEKVFIDMGLDEQALEIVNKIIQIRPEEPLSYYEKYSILQKILNYEPKLFQKPEDQLEVLDYLDKTIELYAKNQIDLPSYGNLLIEKGTQLKDLPCNTEAIECFEKAEKIKNNSYKIYAGLAEIFLRQEKLDDAFDRIEESLRIEPNNEEILKIKFRIVSAQRKNDEILATIEQILKIEPNSEKYLKYKGLLLEELGKLEEAEKTYYSILQINQEDLSILRRKVACERKLGKKKEEEVTLLTIKKILDRKKETGENMKKAIIIWHRNDHVAVNMVYNELDERFGEQNLDWFLEKQSMESYKDKTYDKMTIRLTNGEIKDIYFDITMSMGSNLAFRGEIKF